MEGLDATLILLSALERTKRIDAEFFSKRHLRVAALLSEVRKESLQQITNVSDGNHFAIADEFVDEGIPYYRGGDVVGNFFVEQCAPYLITQRAFEKEHMRRSHLYKGDVLLSIIGTIGESSLVSSGRQATCSCKLAILRPHTIAPEYLAIFLRSEVGRSQTARFTRGAVQTGLLLEDMDQIYVARFSGTFEKAIAELVESGRQQFEDSKRIAAEAEETLTAALGLRDWQPPEPLTYTRRASAALIAGRIDSEYWHPAKQAYLEALGALRGRPLSGHFRAVRDMFDPAEASPNLLVRNFDLTHALQPVLDDTTPATCAAEIGSAKKRFAYGDLAVSRLRHYLREIALVRTTPEVTAVGSSEFIVLRPEPHGKLPVETLLVFLRSHPVQTILKWSQDGSHHPRFGEDDLLSIPVPDAVWKAAPVINAKINAVLLARQRARDHLAAAQRVVEIAIERSERDALAYLGQA